VFFSKKPSKLAEKIKTHVLDYYAVSSTSEASKRFSVVANDKQFDVFLPFADKLNHSKLRNYLSQNVSEVTTGNVSINTNIPITAAKVSPIPNVKNVIAVSSGKGGVGKSATAVNLAFALQAQGARVGILDADIYGPSIPIMLGNPEAHPNSEDQKIMQAIESQGLVANSMGYLVSPESAAIWRGPMATKAIKQLTYETRWPLLDYLIIDMPPGTGDVHLTLAQSVPISAAVIVTTPQTIATADAKKGIAMFEKLNIPVLGIVENMSYFECKCGEKTYPFSQGGSETLAKQFDLEVLGELPLHTSIREHADHGKSLIDDDPTHCASKAYLSIASKVSLHVGLYLKLHELVNTKTGGSGAEITIVNAS